MRDPRNESRAQTFFKYKTGMTRLVAVVLDPVFESAKFFFEFDH